MTEEQQQVRLWAKPSGKIWYLSRNIHDEKGNNKKKQWEKLSFFKEELSAKTMDKAMRGEDAVDGTCWECLN